MIVAGGGISGALAAISAARCGASVLLIEQYGFLGGMLTAGGVGPMMTFHAGEKQVIRGLCGELIDAMCSRGWSPGHCPDTTGYTYTVTPFDAEGMKHQLEQMALAAGVQLLYHVQLAAVEAADGQIQSITVAGKSGLMKLTAQVYIDATGDADLSAWAGVKTDIGRSGDRADMPMTMNVKLGRVDIPAVRQYMAAHMQEFRRLRDKPWLLTQAERLSVSGFSAEFAAARERGELTSTRGTLLFFETNNPGEVIINTTQLIGYDATDAASLSAAETEGRRQALEIERFVKRDIPGFQNAVLLSSGPAVGVRTSRRIRGCYTLTAEDLLTCTLFEDAIAHSGYPIDIHPPKGAADTRHMEDMKQLPHFCNGEIYSIPYRSLVNPMVSNLITVGRCISATFEAQAAIRVSPTAGAIGQAGGAAAYLACRQHIPPSRVDIGELQELLISQGAYNERM